MTAEIFNLKRARKARDRLEKERAAEVNRRVHGMTKAERQSQAAEVAKLDKTLDGARREKSAEDDRDSGGAS